ncbi:MAG: hypothetical protein QG590_699 [Pseudomonadota bacterium]|nr:hypothetical protein [Pseudomonadota bacterium]
MSASASADSDAELSRLREMLDAERRQRERLELALRASGDGFWEWDPATDQLFLSALLSTQIGLPDAGQTIRGEDYLARMHPDDAEKVRAMLGDLLRSDSSLPAELDFRIRNADDQWSWARVRALAARGGDGRVGRIAGMHADISKLKEAESVALDLADRYRMLYEAAPVALVMWNPRGHVTEWNQQAEKLFGWHAAQVFGKRLAEDLVAENDREVYADMARRATAENRVVEAVTSCRTRDGDEIRCRWSALALRQNGQLVGLMTLALDITEQYRNEQQLDVYRNDLERLVEQRTDELANAREALAQIIDKSPVPTFVLDENHCITQWNQACEKIIGVPASEMIGTANQWRAFYRDSRPVLADLVMFNDHVAIDSLYTGKVRPSPVVPGAFEAEDYFPALGRWLFFTAAAIRDGEGEVVGAIETLQDISMRKQAEMALLEAKAEAEAAARVKAEFLANMSHEIRTPLNAIIGFAHLLQKSELSTKQSDHVQRLSSSSDMLLQLINDILDFSKIEAGHMQIESADFVLDEVLDNLSAMVAQRAREKGLELHFVLENDVPQRLVGDSLRLTQVLVNLLSNATKFTEAGQILVFVSVAERSDTRVRLEIAVQDTGIGVSPEQQTRLFRAFSQADTSTTRKYGGTGLGLTICNRLVELMGGKISLSSEPGIGSTFLFDVPLGIGQGTAPGTATTGNKRVLVVDDNAIARTVLSRLVEKLGYRPDTADSGEAALKKVGEAGNDPYQLVFLDWNMPGMNGVEVARRLRTSAQPTPGIVVVTAAGQSEADAAFADAEVNALVLKPVSATSLAAALAAMASEPTREPPAERQRHEPRLKGLRVLLVDDVPTNREIASEILIDEGVVVGEAENGRLAVDKVLHGGPWDAVLMDVQMPEMNGLDATRAIRGDARFAALPIFAMTAFALEEEKQRCLASGMDGFLTKPIDPEAVVSTLAAIAKRIACADRPTGESTSSPVAPQASQPPSASTDFPTLPGIDTAEGLKRMMNKPAFYEKMLKSFHDRFINAPTTVREHLAAGRIEDARREAHSAKGVSASVSANHLREQALVLEKAIAAGQADVTMEIAAFSGALDEVLAGLRAQFGWPIP